MMLDLQLLAFQTDLTRVISFMVGKEQSARPYPQIGVPEAHHPLSHHNQRPELIAQMSKINAITRSCSRDIWRGCSRHRMGTGRCWTT